MIVGTLIASVPVSILMRWGSVPVLMKMMDTDVIVHQLGVEWGLGEPVIEMMRRCWRSIVARRVWSFPSVLIVVGIICSVMVPSEKFIFPIVVILNQLRVGDW